MLFLVLAATLYSEYDADRKGSETIGPRRLRAGRVFSLMVAGTILLGIAVGIELTIRWPHIWDWVGAEWWDRYQLFVMIVTLLLWIVYVGASRSSQRSGENKQGQ